MIVTNQRQQTEIGRRGSCRVYRFFFHLFTPSVLRSNDSSDYSNTNSSRKQAAPTSRVCRRNGSYVSKISYNKK